MRLARARTALLLAALALPLLPTTDAAAAATLVVDDDRAQCPDAGFSTIAAAVAQAAAGDTVRVCAGTYPERVATSTPLTLLGAQASRDARTGRTDPAAESVVGASDGFLAVDEPGAGAVTVDGFRVVGATAAQDTAALSLTAGAGHVVRNTVFAGTSRAVSLTGAGALVERNLFVGGENDGVFIGSAGGDGARVVDNLFVDVGNALDTDSQSGAARTDGLVFRGNTVERGGNGVVLYDTEGAVLADNEVTGVAGSAFLLSGGSGATSITGNRVSGSGRQAVGVSADLDDSPIGGLQVVGNVLRDNAHALRLFGAGTTDPTRLRLNEIVGNDRPGEDGPGAGVRNDSTSPVDATDNWWGCNTGPGTAGCDDVTGAGPTDADPWLVLRAVLADRTPEVGRSAGLRADLTRNSAGEAVGSDHPDGSPVRFSGGELATVAPPTAPLVDGQARSVLTAGAATGGGTASASFDGATVDVPYTVQDVLTVSVGDVRRAEGGPGSTTPFVFPITLSRASDRAEQVAYTAYAGTAASPSDVAAASGALRVPAGSTRATVQVDVAGDRLAEATETFTLRLRPRDTSVDVADGTGTGTIVDDDPRPLVGIGDAAVVEGDSGTRVLRFPVRLDRPSGAPVTVRFATANDTARAPWDFAAASGTVTLAPGDTQALVDVLVRGDRRIEADERLTVVLSAPDGGRLGDASGAGVVRDDDRGRPTTATRAAGSP